MHSLFLNEAGQVFAAGSNASYCLGIDSEEKIWQTQTPVLVPNLFAKKVVANQSSACISASNELYIWGETYSGVFMKPEKVITISADVDDVALGVTVSVAKDKNGLLWTWGQNKHGELGFGDKDARQHPFPLLQLKGK